MYWCFAEVVDFLESPAVRLLTREPSRVEVAVASCFDLPGGVMRGIWNGNAAVGVKIRAFYRKNGW